MSGKKQADDDAIGFALFVSNLASLVERGFRPVKALSVMDEAYGKSKPTALSNALSQVVEALDEGAPIPEAFDETGFFPEAFISLLTAGETSSFTGALRQYGRYLTVYQTAGRAFRSTMTYPLVMLSAIVVAIFGFTGWTVPKMLIPMAEKAGRAVETLPFMGRVLFRVSGIVNIAGPVGALIMCAGIIYFIWGPGRSRVEKVFMLVPAVRDLFFRLSWATYLQVFSILLSSGLLLKDSLEACEGMAPADIAPHYDEILEAVTEGGAFSEQLADKGVDSLIVLSIESGEQSGQLGEVAHSIAEQYMAGMEQEIKQAASSLEPVVIVLLAAVGGSMAGGLMMTIMSLSR